MTDAFSTTTIFRLIVFVWIFATATVLGGLPKSSSPRKNGILKKVGGTANTSSTIMKDEDNPEETVTIGGGSINEKERLYHRTSNKEQTPSSPLSLSAYDPSNHRSHLIHAIEGLNRYPNYLSRWQENDIRALETELEQLLEKVKNQASKATDQHDDIQKHLRVFYKEHPEWEDFCRPPETWEDVTDRILDPRAAKAIRRSLNDTTISVDDVLSGRTPVDLDVGYLQEWMDEELFDVYSFPLLSKTFCHKLCRYASAFLEYMESSSTTSSFYYKNMDRIGLGWFNNLVFWLILKPISSKLYKATELHGGDLDWRHGFIAAYSSSPSTSKPRQHLVPHTDDAEVTLNLCFGDQFTGGDLRFWGLRGDEGKFVGEYEPEIGRALVHSGRHLHEVTPITSGNRFAYIQWARSWGSTRTEVCPCCWLNRRRHNDLDGCVCGKRWN